MSNYVTDFGSQVHDNTIKSYSVDFTSEILRIDTCWGNKENSTIEFTGLLAHKFENVINSNIIFGLYQTTTRSFIDDEKEELLQLLKFGFPSMKSGNLDELINELESAKYKVFYLDSTLGLCGYIIAKDINIVKEK